MVNRKILIKKIKNIFKSINKKYLQIWNNNKTNKKIKIK